MWFAIYEKKLSDKRKSVKDSLFLRLNKLGLSILLNTVLHMATVKLFGWTWGKKLFAILIPNISQIANQIDFGGSM